MIVQKRDFTLRQTRNAISCVDRTNSLGLEVRCSVDGARVVVLVQCALEGCALGTGSGAGSLLTRTGANGGAAHQIIVFLVVLSAALLLDPPDHDSQDTDDDGTANADNDTDDDLLVGVGNTAARGFVAAVAVQRRRGGVGGLFRSRGHHMGHGGTADSLVGSDGLNDRSFGGGRAVR